MNINRIRTCGFIAMLVTFICVVISCETWYSYCFNIHNYTSDSIEIKTTPLISSYKLQIHNFIIRNTGEQGFSEYIEHPIDTVYAIPPKATLSASIGWYSHHSASFMPEKDGVIPLWKTLTSISSNGRKTASSIWDNESKWRKKITNANTGIEYELDIEETMYTHD